VSSDPTELIQRALLWIGQDQDQETRAELADLIDRVEKSNAEALAELEDRFSGYLTFGTAGLRAEIGAGPMRMNSVVVSHAASGLAQFLRDHTSGASPSVVVGYDARHKSRQFARDTAEIMQAAGIRALLFDQHTPTPVLAFAVRHLSVDAGVMVTASHNPPADNGYKVYLGGDDGGSQIVPPADSEIHDAITASHQSSKANALPRSSDYESVGIDVLDAYVEATGRVVAGRESRGRDGLRICYTPMHGVGASVFHRVLDDAGFTTITDVAKQITPDPDFPTVAFPNPEEPGALDLAIETAAIAEADLIIAHDPDADRLAVALPLGDDQTWSMLSGNEVGALLAWELTRGRDSLEGVLGCSLVSSPILGKIAQARGLSATTTPTGFKWISRLPGLLFGFEEALGYLVNPETVRDKDGISAGLLLASIAAEQKAHGSTLRELLADIQVEVSGFASDQISLRFDSPQQAADLMVSVRQEPEEVFANLGVNSITDYRDGAAGLPPANIVQFDLSSGDRIIMRPSGTEPKLKVYIDSLRPSQAEADEAAANLVKQVRESIKALTEAN
jgi:phosphomannomutase